ncbi:MAG: T9SS type A sorting domain-containing protein [Bacteroidales bacterium]
MIRKIVVFLLCIMYLHVVNAQQITFSKVIEGGGHAGNILPAWDNGYFFSGRWSAGLIKIDSTATVEWSREYYGLPGPGTLQFNKMNSTLDSGLVFAGNVYNASGGNTDGFCLRTDVEGDTVWARAIHRNSENIFINDVQQASDSGFILAGNIESDEIIAVKLDKAGNYEWSTSLVLGNNINLCSSVTQVPDGGFVFIGNIMYSPPMETYFVLIKINSDGTVDWSKKYYHTTTDWGSANDVIALDGGLLCLLFVDNKITLMKTDWEGNYLWNKSYSEPDIWMVISVNNPEIHLLPDSTIVFGYGSEWNSKLIRADLSGNILWARHMMMDRADVAPAGDKGFMVLGNGPLYGVKTLLQPQIGLIKTDSLGLETDCILLDNVTLSNTSMFSSTVGLTTGPGPTVSYLKILHNDLSLTSHEGCVDVTGNVNKVSDAVDFQVYPNPSTGKATVKAPLLSVVEVYSVTGTLLHSFKVTAMESQLDLTFCSSGVYIIKCISGDRIKHQVFVKE